MDTPKTEGKHTASGTTVRVDRATCIASATCVTTAPGSFQLDADENKVMIIDPNKEDLNRLIDAAKSCPVNAITIIDKEGRQLWPK